MLNIVYMPPQDPYTRPMRCTVLLCTVFGGMMAGGMIYGKVYKFAHDLLACPLIESVG